MLADAAAAAAAAEAACIEAAAAWTACIMSGGYLLPGVPPWGNAEGGPPGPIWPVPNGGYGRGPRGPNGPEGLGNKGKPAPFEEGPPFGCPGVGRPPPGALCILYIASNKGWIGLG